MKFPPSKCGDVSVPKAEPNSPPLACCVSYGTLPQHVQKLTLSQVELDGAETMGKSF